MQFHSSYIPELTGDNDMDAYHAEIAGLVQSIGGATHLPELLLVIQSFSGRCFGVEEARMLSCHFPQAAKHLAEHGAFLAELQRLSDATDPEVLESLSRSLVALMQSHFDREDHRLVDFLKKHGHTDTLSSEPLIAFPQPEVHVHPLHLDIASYLVGDDRMDVDHAQLIDIVNAVTSDHLPYREAIHALTDYAEYHFRMEEERMQQTDYPEFEAHMAAHNNFRLRLKWLAEKPEEDEIQPGMLHRYLGMWLVNHILHVDRRLAAFLKERAPAQS